jgi:dTDP-4-dehydrorhamnose 3,5-epimerase
MTEFSIEGVRVTRLDPIGDHRGAFTELFRQSSYPHHFVQSNHSSSRKGALRGLHYHRRQDDLWYVVNGRAQVALADLRVPMDPPKTASFILDAADPGTVFIPAGVAHGFLALTDVDLIYLVTQEYDPEDEYGIAWDDPSLAIPWEIEDPILSPRDAANPRLVWDEIRSLR